MKKNNGIGEAIKNARLHKNISASELCRLAKIPKSSLSDWENGKSQPSAKSFLKILEVLGMTASKLLQYKTESTNNNYLPKTKIPVLGTIPAGIPLEAIEDVLDYEEISEEMANKGEYFALKVRGDSMFPIINDGDTLIIKKQDDADSGKICVVMINGYDATLKEIKKEPNGLWVLPKNPYSDFKATFFTNEEIINTPVRIIGVAVEIRRSL